VICDSESCGPAAPSSSVPKVRLPLALPVNLFISAIMALKLPPRSCIWSFSRTASLALIKKRNFNKRYSSSDLHGETYASCLCRSAGLLAPPSMFRLLAIPSTTSLATDSYSSTCANKLSCLAAIASSAARMLRRSTSARCV
jgi:hypothetical protein